MYKPDILYPVDLTRLRGILQTQLLYQNIFLVRRQCFVFENPLFLVHQLTELPQECRTVGIDLFEVVVGKYGLVPGGGVRPLDFGRIEDQLLIYILYTGRECVAWRQILFAVVRLARAANGTVKGVLILLRYDVTHLAHTHEFEEGSGQRQVDQALVLDTLGQEGAEEVEQILYARDVSAILGEGCGEQPAAPLDVITRGFHTVADIHLHNGEVNHYNT